MIEAKQIFSGQRRRYGDYHIEYDIITDCLKDEVVNWCFDNLGRKRVPEEKEWQQAWKNEDGSIKYSVYFAGYYTITAINGGFRFKLCYPNAD